MAATDWTLWNWSSGTRITTSMEEFLVSNPFTVSGDGTALVLEFIDTFSDAWVGRRYSGGSIGLLPNNYLLVSAHTMNISSSVANGIPGFLIGSPTNLSGDVTLASDITGIFVSNNAIPSTTDATITAYLVNSAVVGSALGSITIPQMTPNTGETQLQIAALFNDTKGPPTPPEVKLYIRWNTATTSSTPGSAGWSGWTLLANVDTVAEKSVISTLLAGNMNVSFVTRQILAGTGVYVDIAWDDITIDVGTIV